MVPCSSLNHVPYTPTWLQGGDGQASLPEGLRQYLQAELDKMMLKPDAKDKILGLAREVSVHGFGICLGNVTSFASRWLVCDSHRV